MQIFALTLLWENTEHPLSGGEELWCQSISQSFTYNVCHNIFSFSSVEKCHPTAAPTWWHPTAIKTLCALRGPVHSDSTMHKTYQQEILLSWATVRMLIHQHATCCTHINYFKKMHKRAKYTSIPKQKSGLHTSVELGLRAGFSAAYAWPQLWHTHQPGAKK